MFQYLWEEIGFIDWGLNNLEWILTVICYNKNEEFMDFIFASQTFIKIVRSQHFKQSMTFLEDYITLNTNISEELKTKLFSRPEMIVYDFMGTLSALDNLKET